MNKEQRLERRRQSMRHPRNPAKLLIGSWDVEYMCSLHINVEPTPPDKIEEKVAQMRHTCQRDKCRAWRFIRITEENMQEFTF